jgi:hypothetical protein
MWSPLLTHPKITFSPFFRHASIDAATRAARGLPEDLIRLCVGIEDPYDLLDDLERALIDAGAIALDPLENKYVKVLDNDALALAVRKLQLDGANEKEWFISAPGKVILFGEHAVVHGVVSHFLPSGTFLQVQVPVTVTLSLVEPSLIITTGSPAPASQKFLLKSNGIENPLLTLSPPFFA